MAVLPLNEQQSFNDDEKRALKLPDRFDERHVSFGDELLSPRSALGLGRPPSIQYDYSSVSVPAGAASIDMSMTQLGTPRHIRQETSIGTKIDRINQGKSRNQLAKLKKLKDNNNALDWWSWYWQHPIDRFPIFYFFLCVLSSVFLSLFWWIDHGKCFIIVGSIAITMAFYGSYKFKIAIGLKTEVDTYREKNEQFKITNIELRAEIDRCKEAVSILGQTRKRLEKANDKNKRNIAQFEKIEDSMKLAGQTKVEGMNEIYTAAVGIKEKWRDEYLNKERELLHTVYQRFENKDQNKDQGMDAQEFEEFQEMLPHRYQKRFRRMGTFHTFAVDDSIIDYHEFAQALDAFAEMEVYNKDILLSPSASVRSSHDNMSARPISPGYSYQSFGANPGIHAQYSGSAQHSQMDIIPDVTHLDAVNSALSNPDSLKCEKSLNVPKF